ncbi:MAG: hypothetical protein ACP5SH_05660, partial [Syntrophobacteraceae bacterium]
MFEHHTRGALFVAFFLTLLASSAFAKPAAKAPQKPVVNSQWMTGLFTDGAKDLREKAKDARDRTGQVRASLADTKKKLQELQIKVAMLKTAMAVKTISPPIVAQILNTYTQNETQLSTQSNALREEIAGLTKRRAKEAASEAAIKAQTKILKSSTAPAVWSKQIDQA